MKAIVLSDVPRGHAALGEIVRLLDEQLAQAGYDQVEHFDVADAKLGFCQGEFDCWLRHPGRCKIDDVNKRLSLPSLPQLPWYSSGKSCSEGGVTR